MSQLSFKFLTRHFVNRLTSGRLLDIYRMLGWRVTDPYLGVQILYDPSNDIGRTLFYTGEVEKKEMELCSEYISESSVILDIGANLGLYSIYFSRLAKNGWILAFEPSIETFYFLVKNVANIPNVLPINIAANNEGKIANFFQASDNAYSSLVNTQRKEILKVIKVPCMKVDDVVFGLGLKRVDFVKIDVEGLELNVLKGLEEVITKFKPVIYCEIYKGINSNPQPDETVQSLLERGYRAHVMHNGMLVDYEIHNDAFYNYLFLPNIV